MYGEEPHVGDTWATAVAASIKKPRIIPSLLFIIKTYINPTDGQYQPITVLISCNNLSISLYVHDQSFFIE